MRFPSLGPKAFPRARECGTTGALCVLPPASQALLWGLRLPLELPTFLRFDLNLTMWMTSTAFRGSDPEVLPPSDLGYLFVPRPYRPPETRSQAIRKARHLGASGL